MKGFGFPTNSTTNGGNTGSYKADTSKKKVQLINILKKSE